MFIKVPASTANLGPGFDSFGLAIAKYMNIEVSQYEKWEVRYKEKEFHELATNEENFIIKTVQEIAEKEGIEIPSLLLEITSDIPLTRGLGSSASAIVAAIEIVSHFAENSFSKEKKLLHAYHYENHIDNIGATIFGGFVVGAVVNETPYCKQLPFPECDIVAVIPSYELATIDARRVLPEKFDRQTAVLGSNVANTLLASLVKEDWETAGEMMMSDCFHQPYRASLIPEYQYLYEKRKELGVYGVVISGAGPTVLLFCEKGKGERIVPILNEIIQEAQIEIVNIAKSGVEKSLTKIW